MNQARVYHPLFNYPMRVIYNTPKRANHFFVLWHYQSIPFHRVANDGKVDKS